jgi:glucose/arabinose dehydrogenase
MRKTIGWVVVLALSFAATARAVPLSTVTLATMQNRPVWVGSTPALPNHLFFAEKRGVIKVIDMANANALSTFMDITASVHAPSSGADEQGFLGMAFHPDYANNGFFYVYYTTADNTSNVVSRYTANPGLLTGNTGTALIHLTMPNVESNHNGGCMHFGPDGKLYIATGDGGGAGDVHGTIGNAQKLTSGDNTHYLGKMLRMDVDIASPYIPADNPNIGGGGIDLKWQYGLRNPWRFSFDRANGDLYIGDVGQGVWEEVNYVATGTGAGVNYGWRCMEANACYTSPSGPNCTCNGANLTDPVLAYDHTVGLVVIGGHVYRGLEIPGEQGNYFYANYSSGPVWTFKIVGGAATGNASRIAQSGITSFGEDANGEIYLVHGTGTTTGTVRRIVPLNNNISDINADGAKDQLDIDILVNVLLEIPVGDPALENRSDVNDDGAVNGTDIQAWIDAP